MLQRAKILFKGGGTTDTGMVGRRHGLSRRRPAVRKPLQQRARRAQGKTSLGAAGARPARGRCTAGEWLARGRRAAGSRPEPFLPAWLGDVRITYPPPSHRRRWGWHPPTLPRSHSPPPPPPPLPPLPPLSSWGSLGCCVCSRYVPRKRRRGQAIAGFSLSRTGGL